MAQLRISPRASADLIEIWSYIADDSVVNADGFVDKLCETLQVLCRQPRGVGSRYTKFSFRTLRNFLPRLKKRD